MSRLKLMLEGARSHRRILRPSGLAALILTFAPSLALAAPPATDAAPAAEQKSNLQLWVDYFQEQVPSGVLDVVVKLVLGLGLFIAGWIVAKLIQWIVFWALCKTRIDDWLAEKLGIKMLLEGRKKDSKEPEDPDALERGIAKVVYWLVMALVVVAVLEKAGLEQAAGPIQGLVDTVIQALPIIGMAVGILAVAYIAGLILRIVVSRGLGFMDDRFAKLDGEQSAADTDKADEDEDSKPFSETAGQVAFWLVMLIGLTGAFDALGIEAISNPLSNAVDSLVAVLPAVGIAALIAIGGWLLARIARTVVTSALESVGFDKLVAKARLDSLFGESTPSKVVGWLTMAFIVLQTAIAALDRIGLATLSEPMTDMMTQFWDLIPALLVSVLFVALGVFVGRLLGSIAQKTLEGVGFDRLMDRIGFGQIAEREDELGKPSGLAGFVVQAGIILLAIVQALNNLELEAWAYYVDAFLVFAVTRAAVALLIVGIGFTVGNYVRDLIEARTRGDEPAPPKPSAPEGEVPVEAPVPTEAPGRDPVWMAEFARYAVLVFTFTMAVHQLGVAEDFVLLSFALLFGALCLAGALAFGLGARDLAGEIVRDRYRKSQQGSPGAKGSSLFGSSSTLNKPPSK